MISPQPDRVPADGRNIVGGRILGLHSTWRGTPGRPRVLSRRLFRSELKCRVPWLSGLTIALSDGYVWVISSVPRFCGVRLRVWREYVSVLQFQHRGL